MWSSQWGHTLCKRVNQHTRFPDKTNSMMCALGLKKR